MDDYLAYLKKLQFGASKILIFLFASKIFVVTLSMACAALILSLALALLKMQHPFFCAILSAELFAYGMRALLSELL